MCSAMPAAHGAHRLELLARLRLGRGDRLRRRLRRARALLRLLRRGLGGAGGVGSLRRLLRARPAPPDSMKPRMSFFVTRPPRPVPCTWPGSTPCSDAIRATTGETKVLPSPWPFAAAAAGVGSCARVGGRRLASRRRLRRSPRRRPAGVAGSGARRLRGLAGRRALLGRLRRAARRRRSPRASSRPRPSRPPGRGSAARRPRPGSAPRCRPCRSRSRAAARRRRPCSPSCFSHFVIVPSETETPICGITTSMAVPVAMRPPSTRRAPANLRRRRRPAG